MLLDPTLEAKSECISPTGKHVAFTAEKACLLDDPLIAYFDCERRSAQEHAVGSDRGEAQTLFPNGE